MEGALPIGTLPARYYTDAVMFREELERFYFENWICVGREDTIPDRGDYFLRDVAGESIIIVRDSMDVVRAFFNVCRHRGTRMCAEENGTFAGHIRCPYHGWTYGLDGRLVGAPHMDKSDFRREDYPLRQLRVESWDGHLFVHFGLQPRALADHLGNLTTKFAAWRMQDLRLHRRINYDIKANWKLIVLNYNECLHCPVLHPMLNRLTDYLGADNEPATANYMGGAMNFRGGAETMSPDGKRRRDYLPGLSEEQRKAVFYYAVYPNFLLSLHPDYMMIHTLWPQAVDRTKVLCEWYFHPAEIAKSTFHAEDAIEFWDTTNREDWFIVEASQAGIQSRAYTPGPYSKREGLLQAFDQIVVQRNGKPDKR